ncbi:MAG: 30S ribosomal protein S16 [Parcubacteria group bacterium CG1_02_37_51]|uniref:Small ribosomal subunit protein bS16 n=2 Tax=Candidatus Komeiliibacteriota TaxID=1817908 RepID=A0A2M8DQF2_9BACT|nr:MAG: 30S ribosomal protein S16 [Parcubacteria group bacterium CG1_02_37_51]PIY94981.1 MAG: 30S ribosomal protein S16 [Candidatus Komeilibacteria bacterium CG_4_10_14_0_8_um_filter_37_78]PJC01286.1 MAG: 30S ribosomal protein S16 [Candidatus Komeilibacteria bacterium CG_4_9_14_0_8_um_filter_36_9]
MLTIRLSRTGKTKQPYYRIIVLEKNKDPWGDYQELLGNYNPRTKELVIKEDRIKYWVSVGAQMSNTVHNLMIKNGVIEEKPRKAIKISKKRTTKLEAKKKEAEEKVAATKPVEEPVNKEVVDDKETSEEISTEAPKAEEKDKAVDKPIEEAPVEEKTAEEKVDEPKEPAHNAQHSATGGETPTEERVPAETSVSTETTADGKTPVEESKAEAPVDKEVVKEKE